MVNTVPDEVVAHVRRSRRYSLVHGFALVGFFVINALSNADCGLHPDAFCGFYLLAPALLVAGLWIISLPFFVLGVISSVSLLKFLQRNPTQSNSSLTLFAYVPILLVILDALFVIQFFYPGRESLGNSIRLPRTSYSQFYEHPESALRFFEHETLGANGKVVTLADGVVIHIISPKPGQVFCKGQTIPITWDAPGNATEAIILYNSEKDAPGNFLTTERALQSSTFLTKEQALHSYLGRITQNYEWKPPSRLVGTDKHVMVRLLFKDNSLADSGLSQPFTIKDCAK